MANKKICDDTSKSCAAISLVFIIFNTPWAVQQVITSCTRTIVSQFLHLFVSYKSPYKKWVLDWVTFLRKRGLSLRWHNVRRCSVEKKNKTLFFKQVKTFYNIEEEELFMIFFLHLLNFEIKKPYKEKSERPWHCIITRPIKTFFPFQIVMVKNIITLLVMSIFWKKKKTKNVWLGCWKGQPISVCIANCYWTSVTIYWMSFASNISPKPLLILSKNVN